MTKLLSITTDIWWLSGSSIRWYWLRKENTKRTCLAQSSWKGIWTGTIYGCTHCVLFVSHTCAHMCKWILYVFPYNHRSLQKCSEGFAQSCQIGPGANEGNNTVKLGRKQKKGSWTDLKRNKRHKNSAEGMKMSHLWIASKCHVHMSSNKNSIKEKDESWKRNQRELPQEISMLSRIFQDFQLVTHLKLESDLPIKQMDTWNHTQLFCIL